MKKIDLTKFNYLEDSPDWIPYPKSYPKIEDEWYLIKKKGENNTCIIDMAIYTKGPTGDVCDFYSEKYAKRRADYFMYIYKN